MKIQKFKISNFNSSIIFLVILVFGLLFFYSIPNIHNKHDLQKHLSKEIDKIYPFDISLSPDITYSILPKPHFKVKNSKIQKQDDIADPSQFTLRQYHFSS